MDVAEDLEDIKRLNDLIEAENSAKEDSSYYGIQESDSSDQDNSDSDDSDDDEETTEIKPVVTEVPKHVDTSVPQSFESNRLTDISYLTPHLTYEEYDIIMRCENMDLKKLLILNRVKMLQLKQLNQKYYTIVAQCDNNLKYENDLRNRSMQMTNKRANCCVVGAPYFRDDKLYPCPPNADIVKKRRSGEINIHYLSKRKVWNVSTRISIKSRIRQNYLANLFCSYEEELRIIPKKGVANQRKRKELRERLENWKTTYDSLEYPGQWDDDLINWDEVAERHFNGNYLPASVKSNYQK